MIDISEIVDSELDSKLWERKNMMYYKDFNFSGSNLGQENVFIVQIESKEEEGVNVYQIYDKDKNLIATVEADGKIRFTEEYIESLKEIDESYMELLELEDIELKLPEELKEDDLVFTREELSEYKEREKEIGEKEVQKENKEEEKEEQEQENDPEKEQENEIAKLKGIPQNNVLKIRPNSNLYKDHPNLEPNLYFYKDNNGVIKAEYIDENGNSQPSKYFEPSTTGLREETVSIGDDGNPVKREVPYQVMKTNGLSGLDKDVRDVHINISIDSYGYLDISESRQGMNGQWVSHDVEVRGRKYNSYEVDKETSMRTGEADPDKQSKSFEGAERTGLAKDGIQYDEMYLIEHAEEIIEGFVDEGYRKEEAVEIYNLMIGEKTLTEDEAKKEVNQEIHDRSIEEEREKEEREKEDEGYERVLGE